MTERAVISTLYALTGHYNYARMQVSDTWFIGAKWENIDWWLKFSASEFLSSNFWKKEIKKW